MQMDNTFEGFPQQECIVWVGNIVTPVAFNWKFYTI